MAPAVPDAKDHDTIVLDAVADDVRMDDGGLAKIGRASCRERVFVGV